jgi:hypothetical protein
MKPHARSPPAWCAGGMYSLWHGVRGSPTKRNPWPTIWGISWNTFIMSIIMPLYVWKWPVTEWRPATTAYSTLLDRGRRLNSGCTIQPGSQESHLSCGQPVKVLTSWWPSSAM